MILQPNLQLIFYTQLGVYVQNLVTIGLFLKSYNKKSMFADPRSKMAAP